MDHRLYTCVAFIHPKFALYIHNSDCSFMIGVTLLYYVSVSYIMVAQEVMCQSSDALLLLPCVVHSLISDNDYFSKVTVSALEFTAWSRPFTIANNY